MARIRIRALARGASRAGASTASARLCGIVALVLGTAGWAQNFPTKPMRIVVPYPASGPTDVTARILGQKLSESFGKPVVIDNRPGAGGIIGCDIVAKANADGHTLLIMPVQIAINPSLYAKMPFDTLKDLRAVSQLTTQPYLLVVPATAPFKSVKELIAAAKSRPGELRCASSGIGGGNHLACELFNKLAGTKITHIPYKGAAPALVDTLAGRVDMYMPNPITALKQVEAGKLRALAFTGLKRVDVLPDLPTVAEVLPGFDAGVWMGLFAPGATPSALVTQIQQETARILQQPDVRRGLTSQGGEIVASTPTQFAAFMQAEVRKWAEMVKISGAKAE